MALNAIRAKGPATGIALFTYVVMAGFFTQSGVILAPAAAYFGRSLADTAAMFSYLLGGNLIGIVVSLRLFDVVSIKRALTFAYGVMFAGIAMLYLTHVFTVALAAIALVGFGGGLGLSAGAIILTKTYAAQQRATAFLGTDCAFSLAGFIVPGATAFALAHGYRWTVGYVGTGLLAVLVLVVAAGVQFPRAGKPAAMHRDGPLPKSDAATLLRIGLFGLGLALYLFGQSAFLIWAPSTMQAIFGISARAAGNVVSDFWGPSIFGLLTASLLVMRVAPRIVLVAATSLALLCLSLVATAPNAGIFFTLTLGFGFTSTCMYKLMISIGSEQIESTPPQLVTFLLLAGSVGGTLAPFASAGIVRAFGPHAGVVLALGCYATAFAVVVIALGLERSSRIRVTSATVTS